MTRLLVSLLILLSCAPAAFARDPATIDTTYGNHGRTALTDAVALLATPTGGLVGAGISADRNTIPVTRLDPSGRPDRSFGGDGHIALPVGDTVQPDALALAPDGALLIAATAHFAGVQDAVVVVLRVLANGRLDPGFGSNGGALTTLTGYGAIADSLATGITVQASGRIVVLGRDYRLTALTPSGHVDRAFAEQGIAAPVTRFDTDPDLTSPWATGLAQLPDGRLIVAGQAPSSPCDSHCDFFGTPWIVRLAPNGALDPTFGMNGLATGHPIGTTGLAVDASGRVVVSGETCGWGNALFDEPCLPSTLRLNPDGAVDTGFDTGPGSGSRLVATSRDGAVLFGPPGLTRVTSTGEPDPTFGRCGLAAADLRPLLIAPLASGRILIVSSQERGGPFVTRLLGTGRTPRDGRPDAIPPPPASIDEAPVGTVRKRISVPAQVARDATVDATLTLEGPGDTESYVALTPKLRRRLKLTRPLARGRVVARACTTKTMSLRVDARTLRALHRRATKEWRLRLSYVVHNAKGSAHGHYVLVLRGDSVETY